jgi:hypothetical protein
MLKILYGNRQTGATNYLIDKIVEDYKNNKKVLIVCSNERKILDKIVQKLNVKSFDKSNLVIALPQNRLYGRDKDITSAYILEDINDISNEDLSYYVEVARLLKIDIWCDKIKRQDLIFSDKLNIIKCFNDMSNEEMFNYMVDNSMSAEEVLSVMKLNIYSFEFEVLKYNEYYPNGYLKYLKNNT